MSEIPECRRSLEDYLGPIYRSEAAYILPLMSEAYPMRLWTKFESDQFRKRFGDEAVIPIRFVNVRPGFFSDDQKYGSLPFDPEAAHDEELERIADTICKRLEDDRREAGRSEAVETVDVAATGT